jgi:hypothetical protein
MQSTTPASTVVDLFTQHLQLQSGGTIRADERRMSSDDADWRLAIFHAETAGEVHPDHWESHPLADEAVCCLQGAIRLYLRAVQPGTPEGLVRLIPGRAVIVPRNQWHRFAFDQPTDLLTVTVRRNTQLERRTIAPTNDSSVIPDSSRSIDVRSGKE